MCSPMRKGYFLQNSSNDLCVLLPKDFTSMRTILLPHESRKFSKSCCYMKKKFYLLQQQTYPASRKNSALRVSLFLFRYCELYR